MKTLPKKETKVVGVVLELSLNEVEVFLTALTEYTNKFGSNWVVASDAIGRIKAALSGKETD